MICLRVEHKDSVTVLNLNSELGWPFVVANGLILMRGASRSGYLADKVTFLYGWLADRDVKIDGAGQLGLLWAVCIKLKLFIANDAPHAARALVASVLAISHLDEVAFVLNQCAGERL